MRAPTTEEILAKCPGEIPVKTIPLVNQGGRPRRYGHKKHKWHSEEDRIKAATVYAITGNSKRVEEITSIPSYVVRRWKTEPWWSQVIDRIRQEADDELDVKFTGIIDQTIDVINDRLANGDYIYDMRNQQMIRRPVSGKETAVITSIFMDKRNMIREKKKVHAESEAVMDRLKKLATEFTSFVKAKDVTKESNEIKEEEEEVLSE